MRSALARRSELAGRVRRSRLVAGLAVMMPLLSGAAAAHTGEPPAPHDFWRMWSWEPEVLIGIALSGWLYARGVRRIWCRAGTGVGITRWQAASFAGGLAALFVALISPLDGLGAALFSAHMLQHVVLMLVAAPLLVVGTPLVPFLWALPPRWRHVVGGWGRAPVISGPWTALTNPFVAWGVHAVALWIWHIPALFEATLASKAVHVLQHLSFFLTALLFWWAALEFSRRRQLNYGFGVFYTFTTAVHSSILGALLTFSLVLWYPIYAERAVRWGLTPLEDQQLGGLVMWVPAGIIYLVAALALFATGLMAAERQRPHASMASRAHRA
jgi:putative membrane protein